MDIETLVIGRKYRVKPIEWFDLPENKRYSYGSPGGHAGKEMILNDIDIGNGATLDLHVGWRYSEGTVWLKREAVDEIPGQNEPSKEIMEMVARLRKEGHVYGYDGGPGGGGGGPMDMLGGAVLPEFFEDGSEGVYLPVQRCKRSWKLEKLVELFENGETSQGFHATQYTYIRTDLKLIKDKKKLPEKTSWSTMRD